MEIAINWWAILVTTITSVILGSLWYGPIFGKAWMKILGMNPEDCIPTPEQKKVMYRSYALVTIGALITNCILLISITFVGAYLGAVGIMLGLQVAFCHWIGFVAPVTLGSVLWESRPWKYWFITAGYYLVILLINGAVLASWM